MFGAELRRRRQKAGMTLEALSRKAHYSKSHLSKLETGAKNPSPEVARACDTALAADGELSSLVPTSLPKRTDPAGPPMDDQEVWLMSLTPEGDTGFAGLDRRAAISLGALSLLSPGGVVPQGTGNAELALASFRSQLGGVRAMGQHTAPTMVFPIAVAHANALRQLARSAPSAQGDAALRLAARFSEYAGWMAQESGDERRALWWTDTAVSLARSGGDREMGEYALVRRALISMYAHDGPQTIALAQHAQRDLSTSARVRGLAAKREAQGHALVGDTVSCERALETARELLDSDDPTTGGAANGPEILGSSHVSDPLGVTHGWCLVDLGRAEAAAEVLDRECALLPSSAARARTRFGVRRALAHALSGEIDHACALTTELLSTAPGADSATVRVDLRRLHQTLARHHGHRAVRDLSPRLVAALSIA